MVGICTLMLAISGIELHGSRQMPSFKPGQKDAWPAGGSELAIMIRNHDWAASSLGDLARWPQSLRTLIDICLAHPLPCAVVCGPDRLLLYNEPCAHLQGDAHPSALGKPAGQAFPEALSDTGPLHKRLLAGEALTFRKRPWVFQHQGILTTGHYDAFFTPVRDELGAFTSVLAMVLDAQADQASMPELSASEHATTPDALWILDYERMRLTYASPALERVMGEDRARVQANFRHWFDLVHPDDREAVTRHLIRSAAGETLVAQYRIVRASDGGIVTVRHTSFPMHGRDKTPGQVAGLVQDVTDIEHANAALLEEKERFRTMVEGIASLTWRSCDEGLWTWAGPQWLDYTGQTQEQSHGWGWLDAVHPDDRQSTMQAWHQARPHGMLEATFRLLRASDQSWRWFQTRSMPRRVEPSPDEPDGQIIEWLGSTTDIHDLKLLQERQTMMIAELERRTASMNGVVHSIGGAVPQHDDAKKGDGTTRH